MKRLFVIIMSLVIATGLCVACDNNTDNSERNGAEPSITEELITSRSPEDFAEKTYSIGYLKYEGDVNIPDFSYSDATDENIINYYKEVNGVKKYGFMDMTFNILTLPEMDNPTVFNNGYSVMTVDGSRTVIDSGFAEVAPYARRLELNGQWAYLYSKIYESGGYSIERGSYHGRTGFDFEKYSSPHAESILVPVSFDAGYDNTGRKLNLYGYKELENCLDEDSEFAIEPVFESAGEFNYGLAPVKYNGSWGYIDENGNIVIDLQYSVATSFEEAVAFVGVTEKDETHWALIDTDGKKLTDYIFSGVGRFTNGYAVVNYIRGNPDESRLIDSSSYIDTKGNLMFPRDTVMVRQPFYDKYALVWEPDKGSYFVNESGESFNGQYYSDAGEFNDGYAAVCAGTKWGYIDETGIVAIEPQYRFAKKFDHGLALVFEDETSCLIDKLGNRYLQELQLEGISRFNDDGYALAYSGSGAEAYYIIHVIGLGD